MSQPMDLSYYEHLLTALDFDTAIAATRNYTMLYKWCGHRVVETRKTIFPAEIQAALGGADPSLDTRRLISGVSNITVITKGFCLECWSTVGLTTIAPQTIDCGPSTKLGRDFMAQVQRLLGSNPAMAFRDLEETDSELTVNHFLGIYSVLNDELGSRIQNSKVAVTVEERRVMIGLQRTAVRIAIERQELKKVKKESPDFPLALSLVLVDPSSLADDRKDCPICSEIMGSLDDTRHSLDHRIQTSVSALLNSSNVTPSSEVDPAFAECPVKLPCNHIFGHDCIKRWASEGSRSCPICRQHLFHTRDRLVLIAMTRSKT